jgi:8-oxo-dGTP diphosphatase
MEREIIIALKGIVVYKGKVLIIKRSDYDEAFAGIWEIPGGRLQFDEELESALIREVKEEAGIEITIEKLYYAYTFMTSPTRQFVILTYLCKTEQDNVTLSNEHTEYLWASKAELKQNLWPTILSYFEKNNVFSLKGLIE